MIKEGILHGFYLLIIRVVPAFFWFLASTSQISLTSILFESPVGCLELVIFALLMHSLPSFF